MKTENIKHLKLINGEELICELMTESGDNIIIRNALSLLEKQFGSEQKYYAFKTYMVYQDTPQNCMVMFTDKIMSLAVPTDDMVTQYKNALGEMKEFLTEQEEKSLVDDWDDLSAESEQDLENFLREMNHEDDFIDSDTDGMIMN
jgi:hypothetical protein